MSKNIYDETICKLGEGPLWHPLRNELFWFDILGKRLLSRNQKWQFENYVSAAGWIDEDVLLIASDIELFKFELSTGRQTSICPLEADNPMTRSNDGRADPWGGFWIGTMGLNAEKNAGAIYRFYKGTLKKLYSDISISNSICFSPDHNLVYYCDTPTQMIMRQKLDGQSGWPIGKPELHIDLRDTDFNPDGAVVDGDGSFWNAQWGSGRIACYDKNGVFKTAIEISAQQASCPAFGGENMSNLFCTSAAVGLSNKDIIDYPNSGKTFILETAISGQEEHQIIL